MRYRLEARYGLPVLQGRELLTLFLRSELQQAASRHALGADFNLGPHLSTGYAAQLAPGASLDHQVHLRYSRSF